MQSPGGQGEQNHVVRANRERLIVRGAGVGARRLKKAAKAVTRPNGEVWVDGVKIWINQRLEDQDGRFLDGRAVIDVGDERLARGVAELSDALARRGSVAPGSLGLRHGHVVNIVHERQQRGWPDTAFVALGITDNVVAKGGRVRKTTAAAAAHAAAVFRRRTGKGAVLMLQCQCRLVIVHRTGPAQ